MMTKIVYNETNFCIYLQVDFKIALVTDFLMFFHEIDNLDTSNLLFSNVGGDTLYKCSGRAKNNTCC